MKKRISKNNPSDYDYLTNAASAGDCTGLIPSLPQSEAELESYNATYQFLPPGGNEEEKEEVSQSRHSD